MNDRTLDAILTLALVASLLTCVWVTGTFAQIPGTVSVATLGGVLRTIAVLAA